MGLHKRSHLTYIFVPKASQASDNLAAFLLTLLKVLQAVLLDAEILQTKELR